MTVRNTSETVIYCVRIVLFLLYCIVIYCFVQSGEAFRRKVINTRTHARDHETMCPPGYILCLASVRFEHSVCYGSLMTTYITLLV